MTEQVEQTILSKVEPIIEEKEDKKEVTQEVKTETAIIKPTRLQLFYPSMDKK